MAKEISNKEIKKLDEYFRAANYLSACQLYLLDNPLLERKLKKEDLKANIVGHWGTVPGQNFIYTHLNRIINKYDLDMIYISGPGHGGNSIVSNVYLEGTYSEIYPNITEDKEGLKKLFKQFSFPGGISSHVAPETPGSINEGGELGYSLSHAFGAVLDNPSLIAACVVGDGEAETGPLATSWHLNKFLNPRTDGIVLPILHLNGYKIANPTVLSRISNDELLNYFKGCGWDPYYLEGKDEIELHKQMALIMDEIVEKLQIIKADAKNGRIRRPAYPMLILRTPKGWTGPKVVEGKQIEGTFRAHQVPIVVNSTNDKNLELLEEWLRSYKPEELFDKNGVLRKDLKELTPKGNRRMGANMHANGGKLLKELRTPDFKKYGVEVKKHGSIVAQDMMELGKYVRDLLKLNEEERNFRIFGPDEALSNRLNAMFEETNRQWVNKTYENDEFLGVDGRVIDSYLSEHFCEGALEGYILTGRHGFIHSYEAFARIIDSMVSQHAKWLKVTKSLSWREDISSLNIILSSHIWQQDHNGYTHQDPGFLNHVATKKASISRIYLPIDANTLLSTFDHCIKTKDYINVIVASKHPRFQWLSMDEATVHCKKGIGELSFISDKCDDPDLVLVSSGDTPTNEVVAAKKIIDKFLNIKTRVINVIDLMRLQSNLEHPHGLSDDCYDKLFTKNKPIIFAFHGYPNLIHMLCYKRKNKNMHVHGYKEEGTITTPFDMRVQNEIDRYHLVLNAIKYLKISKEDKKNIQDYCNNQLNKHYLYIRKHGVDMPDVDKLI